MTESTFSSFTDGRGVTQGNPCRRPRLPPRGQAAEFTTEASPLFQHRRRVGASPAIPEKFANHFDDFGSRVGQSSCNSPESSRMIEKSGGCSAHRLVRRSEL